MLVASWLVESAPLAFLDCSPLRVSSTAISIFAASTISERAPSRPVDHRLGLRIGRSRLLPGPPSAEPWRRVQRLGIRCKITVNHLLASSAIPFVFPATHINRDIWRRLDASAGAHSRHAIHLGADASWWLAPPA